MCFHPNQIEEATFLSSDSAFPSYVVPKCLNFVLSLIVWCLDGHLDFNDVTMRRRVWFIVTMHTGFYFVFGGDLIFVGKGNKGMIW